MGAGLLAVVALSVESGRYCRTWQDPVTLWRHAHRVHPQDPRIAVNLSGALMEEGRSLEALQVLETFLAHQEDSYVLQSLGWARLELGQPALAEEALRRSLALDPSRARAAANLVHLLLSQGRAQEAVEVGRNLVERRPLYAEGWTALGAALLESRRLEEAGPVLARAWELQPYLPSSACNLGSLAWLQEDLEGARRWWSRCLELDPGNTYARRGLESVSLKNTQTPGEPAPQP